MQLCPIIHYITWRRSEENLPWLGLHKEILDSPCFLIPLIYSKHRTKSLIMLNYRGLGGGVKLLFFGNFYPLWLLIMTPIPDYENCKEHLPTHLTFTPTFHDFQPQCPLWFFLYFIFIELLFKTQQKSTVIEGQHSIDYKSMR